MYHILCIFVSYNFFFPFFFHAVQVNQNIDFILYSRIIETTLFYAIQHNKARKNAHRLCFIFNLYHKGSHGSAFQCSTVSVMVLLLWVTQGECTPTLWHCWRQGRLQPYTNVYILLGIKSPLIYFYFGSQCYTWRT